MGPRPVPLPAGWEDGLPARTARERLRDVLRRNFDGVPLWAVKDPRICILLPLWFRVLEDLAVDPRFLLMLRSPWEVARSLKAGHGFATWDSLDLWFRHSTAAEEGDARLGPGRSHVRPSALGSRFRALAGLGEALSIDWPEPLERARPEIEGFLESSLRHWKKAGAPDDVPPDLALLGHGPS